MTTSRWWIILAVVVANSALDLALMTLPVASMLRSISRQTHGLIQPSLVMGTIEFAVVVAGIIFVTGRLKWADVGLDKRKMLAGVAFAFGLWGVVQAITIMSDVLGNQPITLDPQWRQRPLGAVGRALADWLGVALYEEVVFRGFLLVHLWMRFDLRAKRRRWWTLTIALILSQTVFALGHIPYLLHHGADTARLPADMLYLFALGVLFSIVYLSTCNLIFAMAVHAMINSPLLVCNVSGSLAITTVIILTLALIVPIALIHKFRSGRRLGTVTRF